MEKMESRSKEEKQSSSSPGKKLFNLSVCIINLGPVSFWWICRYLSEEPSVLAAALSRSTSLRLLHLHFLGILQLQGLQLLNNTGATENT